MNVLNNCLITLACCNMFTCYKETQSLAFNEGFNATKNYRLRSCEMQNLFQRAKMILWNEDQ